MTDSISSISQQYKLHNLKFKSGKTYSLISPLDAHVAVSELLNTYERQGYIPDEGVFVTYLMKNAPDLTLYTSIGELPFNTSEEVEIPF